VAKKPIREALRPFFYRKCKVRECTEQPSTSDISEWKNKVAKLEGCPNAGVTLSKQDYHSRQELVVVEK
jgi:hypothetical protein